MLTVVSTSYGMVPIASLNTVTGKWSPNYFNAVALFAVYSRYIYQCHVHTDIAHIVGSLAIDKTIAVAVAQFAVQSVGISNRYGCYDAVFFDDAAARVAHGFACWNIPKLQYGGFSVDTLLITALSRGLIP